MAKRSKVTVGMSMTRKSTTGTRNMDKKDLSAADICRIIKQCQQGRVHTFSYQGLSLSFLPHRNEEAASLGQSTDPVSYMTEAEVSEQTHEHSQIELMDKEAMLEAEEAQLMIDDPRAFEQLQIRRDIERNRQLDGQAQTR